MHLSQWVPVDPLRVIDKKAHGENISTAGTRDRDGAMGVEPIRARKPRAATYNHTPTLRITAAESKLMVVSARPHNSMHGRMSAAGHKPASPAGSEPEPGSVILP